MIIENGRVLPHFRTQRVEVSFLIPRDRGSLLHFLILLKERYDFPSFQRMKDVFSFPGMEQPYFTQRKEEPSFFQRTNESLFVAEDQGILLRFDDRLSLTDFKGWKNVSLLPMTLEPSFISKGGRVLLHFISKYGRIYPHS